MNLFINFSHPACVPFFKNAFHILFAEGHTVIAVARQKQFTLELLNAYRTNMGSCRKNVAAYGA